MPSKRIIRALAGLAAVIGVATVSVTGINLATAAEPAPDVRVIRYDADDAPQFTDAIRAGADAWNSRLTRIRIERARDGERADVTFFSDDSWPYADVVNGRIDMGMMAVNQGHHPPRIAAHELGHILGLPDLRTGRCEDLMSGSSAGTSCTNIYPNDAETAQVEGTLGDSPGEIE